MVSEQILQGGENRMQQILLGGEKRERVFKLLI